MKKQLAFVLGGGGSRGALQVGALRALLEAGYRPDLWVGTSIGAANATFLALRGFNQESLTALVGVWQDAIRADLLPSNYLWLTIRTLFNRSGGQINHRMRNFFIGNGLPPELRFKDIHGVRLILVAADLNAGRPILYGTDLEQNVLEGVVASTALPPWTRPLRVNGQYLIDGGLVSNLPIEPALSQGATEIIALGLVDERDVPGAVTGFGPFFMKLAQTIEQRQIDLELALAKARRVPVRYIQLRGVIPFEFWDFSHTDEAIDRGYEIARQEIAHWPVKARPWWQSWLTPLDVSNSQRG
jgi:NTE family protein